MTPETTVCENCGHDEFISGGDTVEIYRVVGGQPEFIRSESDGASPHELMCANCGEDFPLN